MPSYAGTVNEDNGVEEGDGSSAPSSPAHLNAQTQRMLRGERIPWGQCAPAGCA